MDLSRYQDLWNKVYNELESSYSKELFEDTFKEIRTVVKVENQMIQVLVPSLYIQRTVSAHYIYKIDEIIDIISPNERLRFKFVTKEQVVPISTYDNLPDYSTLSFNSNLDRSQTFDSFVVGNSNRMCFKMCMRAADQPGMVGNPLYIFGDVGLGKSHMMNAVGNFMLEKDVNQRILYVSTTEFVRDYQKAAQARNMNSFDEKYGNLDALLMDDVQMLGKAEKTQYQFFHIFEQLLKKNKQIVLTSDVSADKLDGLMDRLKSRFEHGFLADITAPDLELRLNILKRKISENNHEVFSDEVLEYIAECFPKNVRALEGALTRVLFHSINESDGGSDVTLENTKEALAPLLTSINQVDTGVSHDRLLNVVTDFYKVSINDIIGKKRTSEINLTRQICMYLLKDVYKLPYKKIGNILGNRDHTTIMSGFQKVTDELATNIDLKEAVLQIKRKLNVDSTN